jgi:hypothetical protein
MALSYGQRWAIYLLMAQHTGAGPGLRSHLRHAADDYVAAGRPYRDALLQAVTDQVTHGVTAGDIGLLATFNGVDLRSALGLDAYYDPTLGDCPGPATIGGVVKDTQPNIVAAISGATPPA